MDQGQKRKRERPKNVLEEEKEYLLELVTDKKGIIENKKSDTISAKQKRETWNLIANQFNASSKTGTRNAQQLKLLYDNLKKSTKKKLADEKVVKF
jgi:hypothetical protein